ncbi:hypothetical protein B0H11DRAFT_1962650 [Mycena galericulata]|nr:hypothetical protein B0H11DRAFT_1962650 [Mycena galericulata]
MVSRVCIRWHKIALGTPSLWDTIELHSDDLWITTKRIKKAMRLLNLALDRGKHTPLNLGISIVPGMDFARPLELVSQHCERWKNVTFFCRSSDLRRLRGIKGKLPLLETFEIELQDGPSLLDFLQVAPRLRNFGVGGRFLPNIADAYFGQLQELACLGQDPRLVPMAVSFMSCIPHTIKFRLQLFISNWDHDNILGIDLPPTSSNLISLSMDTRDYFAAAHCVKALSDIFSSLTLPQLRNLDFRAENSPLCFISWPHGAFLGLAARSSFHTHLETLFLSDVVVTEAELVETLKALPLLQRLAISDHQLNRTYHHICGANQLLITDSLLVSLALKPNSPRLLPHLHSLSCQSLLKFDDHVYLDFLLSRLAESQVFQCRMYWLPGHHRELDPIVVARLRELCIQKELLHEFAGARAYGP